MKKTIIVWLSVLAIAVYLIACYYDNEEELYPQLSTGCDTTNVTFTKNIAPILASYCSSCHSNANAASFGNGIPLENYSDVTANITKLYNAVTHQGPYPMPKNGAMLNQCSLTQISLWKNNGTPF
jgi:hypothetical protein